MSVPHDEKEAARKALKEINSRSIDENVEYGFLVHKVHGKYTAGKPFSSKNPAGVMEDDFLAALRDVPRGATVTAICHTHGRDIEGYWSELPTREDRDVIKYLAVTYHLSVNSYIATPSGMLVIIDRSSSKDEFPREKL